MKNIIISVMIILSFSYIVYQHLFANKDMLNVSNATVHQVEIEEPHDITSLKEPKIDTPNFILENLQGDIVEWNDYRGEKVLLHFWATWCEPCVDELPLIQQYHENQDHIRVVSINVDPYNDVESFAVNYKLTFPILFDLGQNISNMYGVFTIPTSILVDEEGFMLSQQLGPYSKEGLEDLKQY
ncbi:hypothetical protein Q75_07310 [Bacillus coahuilensis p1.1.43]|uniref:Thioredoxin domain-containing protein n=1 Tax=Bacillus coahuilensis p1.1.43 TaxID=1150625 RepID=A0A147K8Y6_9BACI|nr:redoxin domain-containing protein [Bacillus coahuilensis]KUP06756.1 hypothetical protein Q75_07310 [Bacillus coahuilensis p1.1.43]